jgi:hypothetical protein
VTHPDVRNKTKYEAKVVNDWHRDAFPETAKAIDIDLMGSCPRCNAPLYLIEATENTEDKPTSYLRGLAERSHVEAFLVFHDGEDVTGAQKVWPRRGRQGSVEECITAFTEIRREHMKKHHGMIPVVTP